MAPTVFQSIAVQELTCNQITTAATKPATGAWTTSNVTTDRSIDADSNDALVNGDGLCTLIEDLKTKGIIE